MTENVVLNTICLVLDVLLIPFVYFSGYVLKFIRKLGVRRLPCSKQVLFQIGVFPIRNHYYEPRFDYRTLRYPLSRVRNLPGINWNIEEQLQIINEFEYNKELILIPQNKIVDGFYINNKSFESGDAEYLYNIIRKVKPKKIYEIGSGYSTLISRKAIAKNICENECYMCEHLCIEPYEAPWLEDVGVIVIRKPVEELEISLFEKLEANDILFIDSSHIIRPQGDVLFEYLEILPALKKGVIVHIHDIFSPNDYLKEWIQDEIIFWNEQYLLEAFLTSNKDWKIIGALNFLHKNYYDTLKSKCPFLEKNRNPGSMYITKIS